MLAQEEQVAFLKDISECIAYLAKRKKAKYVKAIRILIQDNLTQAKLLERVANEQRNAGKTEERNIST